MRLTWGELVRSFLYTRSFIDLHLMQLHDAFFVRRVSVLRCPRGAPSRSSRSPGRVPHSLSEPCSMLHAEHILLLWPCISEGKHTLPITWDSLKNCLLFTQHLTLKKEAGAIKRAIVCAPCTIRQRHSRLSSFSSSSLWYLDGSFRSYIRSRRLHSNESH